MLEYWNVGMEPFGQINACGVEPINLTSINLISKYLGEGRNTKS